LRRFSSDLPPATVESIQQGVLATTYRGVPFLKSPFDVLLYMRLIGSLRPRTVIEIGTHAGGSALWFADCARAHGVDARVISIDRVGPPALEDERISFMHGDATALGEVLGDEVFGQLGRPLLVVEDSAHYFETSFAVLEFFHRHLRSGDYIVIEDGIVSQLPEAEYGRFAGGPTRAIERFLELHPGEYEIDVELCDLYGYNATWSPNGWLRRR
jgi:cephalosporin hydroxylase